MDVGREARAIIKTVESREQSEGNGARVRRSIGRPELPRLDPFLMVLSIMLLVVPLSGHDCLRVCWYIRRGRKLPVW